MKRLARPSMRLMRWVGAAVLCLMAGLTAFGVRPDLTASLSDPLYALQALVTLSAMVLAAAGALILTVPGHARSASARWLPIAALAVWLLSLALDFAVHSAAGQPALWDPGHGARCVREIAALGLLPGVILFFMAARGAPLRGGWTGWLVAIALASLGALGTQLSCTSDAPAHVFVWHFLPVVLAGGLGVALGRWLLRW
ncbi:MAG: DUF1109 domain-containing protein [Acidobacteriota bacterium]|nr:MAG: DUF1109 domain-containing protein [Acidobacteriota bacterium]